ncbi:uncharacterized protein LOC143863830 [Tasmannia lanceolata]|uniref:uncharacterized protein LOC143863830 n=1 Tax=Tasmannia lanceolata TaxID=3420 RepID=UPI004063D053
MELPSEKNQTNPLLLTLPKMVDSPLNSDNLELFLPSDIFHEEFYNPQTPSKANPEFFSPKKFTPSYFQFGPDSRFATMPPPQPQKGFRFKAEYLQACSNPTTFGNVGFRTGSRPVYQYHPVKPVQVQARDGFFPRQQNLGQNRVLRFRVNGPGSTGFVRESAGTGVFLPRVFNPDVRKKSSIKRAEQKQSSADEKQGMAFQHPSEMGLPQDWTY